ncbi:MAG: DUF2721 domain-containing protein [Candidatus Omnitrophota bacterium]
MYTDSIIKTLQASVAPCLLISGFGFLLLTMTNRLGRASDRVRFLIRETAAAKDADKRFLKEQITIIYNRCRYLRSAIALLVFSIACVALDVLLLFLSIVFGVNLNVTIEIIFAVSLISLIISLSLFMLDIRLTLTTLKIEIENISKN